MRQRLPGAQQTHDGIEQGRGRHGLDQHIMDRDVGGDTHELVAVVGGDHQHPGLLAQGQPGDLARHGQAIHLGHLPVQEDDVVGLTRLLAALKFGQCQRARLGAGHVEAHETQHAGLHLARLLVVIDHQHAPVLQAELQRRPRGHAATQSEPGGEPERRTPPRHALYSDLAAHELGQALGNDQAQAGAAVLARDRAVGLLKALEQAVPLLGQDADAGVADLEAQQHSVVAALLQQHAQADRTALGELDRVVAEVDQHLTQAQRVADQAGRHFGREFEHQFERLLLGALGQQVDDVVEHGLELELDLLQAHAVGLDLGEIQDIVDHAEQVLARDLDLVQMVELLRRHRGLLQQVGHADHGIHRRADLVAHVGQEIGLGMRRLLGQFLGLAHRLERLALGRDVLHHAEEALLWLVGIDRLHRQAGPETAAVLAHQLTLVNEAVLLEQHRGQARAEFGKSRLVGIEDADAAAQHLAQAVAEHMLQGAVATVDQMILDRHQSRRRGIEDRQLLGAGLAQRGGRGLELDGALIDQLLQMLPITLEFGLCLLELGDVGRNAAQGIDTAIGLAQRLLDHIVEPAAPPVPGRVDLLAGDAHAAVDDGAVDLVQGLHRRRIEELLVAAAHDGRSGSAKQLGHLLVDILVAQLRVLDEDVAVDAVEYGRELVLAGAQGAGLARHLAPQPGGQAQRQCQQGGDAEQAPPEVARDLRRRGRQPPALEHGEIDRRRFALPGLQVLVDRCQQFGVATLAGREEQPRGLEHERRFLQAVGAGVAVTEMVIGRDRVKLPALDPGKALVQRRHRHQFGPQTKAVQHGAQVFLLHRAVEHRHASALQVGHRHDADALVPVQLRPAVQGRHLMEVEQAGAGLVVSHVGHQVDAPFLQRIQAVLPGTGDRDDGPAFTPGDLVDQVAEDARELAVRVRKNLGFVLVHPDADGVRGPGGPGEPRQQERQQELAASPLEF